MRICVVGAGAIGGFLGATLVRGGQEVSLIARGAHLEAIRARGLTLVSGGRAETLSVAASSRPADFGVQDAVFITLKAYSISSVLPTHGPLVGPETAVIPAINGLPWWYFYREGGRFDGTLIHSLDPEGTMFACLDPARILGCVVHMAAEVTGPGEVTHTAGRHFILGEPDGTPSARLGRVADALAAAGLEVTRSAAIRQDIWMKLIGNLSYNPVAALTLAYMNEINANPGLIALLRVMMEEAMAVALAYGIRIPVTVDERIEIARKIGSSKISMHQDVEKGKPLEVDAVIGSVAELARRAGVATPMIDAVHALIAERARHVAAR